MSGIATETAKYVAAVRDVGASTRILDTRKTTPGHRLLEKYAVVCGGGSNHRMGLFDAVLIKDNHVIAAGGITQAVRRALETAPAGVDVEVEVDTIDQLREALGAGATAVLLDNFTPEAVRTACAEIAGRARIEVSGGISLDTVAAYAAAGADDISVGRLTHSAATVDISMEIELLP
jgi:nicotinate-nucleotide pyrophosphorylase (carboxylating)